MIGALLFSFGIIILVNEWLQRRGFISAEFSREVVHVSSALLAWRVSLITSWQVFVFLTLLLGALMWLSYTHRLLLSVHGVTRKTYGELLFPVGVLMAYWISYGQSMNFVAAMLTLGISDMMAGWINARFPPTRWWGNGQSAFAISCFVILILLFGKDFVLEAFLGCLFVAVIERVSVDGWDNLTIPVGMSLILLFV